ncbi:MAG TPA: hypothetical protein VHL11_16380, partial [Phototrophicaceae bacterium]|nr:hypothetical protein [Phototrophicaceae bacterium]
MRSATIFNAISLLFLILTIVVIVVVGGIMISPVPVEEIGEIPTTVPDDLFPTNTPTFTHTATFTATFPPTLTSTFTYTPSITPSVTPSLTPTITLSPTITFTPTITLTPSITNTLPTDTPSGPTETLPPTVSPYLFGLREPVRYVPNFANTLGCSWEGIGGQVIDLNDQEVLPGTYQIRVFGGDIQDKITLVGSNSLYGPISGWEVQVASIVNSTTYFVRLETINGTPISENLQVPFFADCARNVAIVNFKQLR